MPGRLSLTARQVGSLEPRFGPHDPFVDCSFGPRVPPRRDCIDDYLEPGERIIDIALHTLSLRFQELLQSLEFQRQSFEFLDDLEVNSATDDMIRSLSPPILAARSPYSSFVATAISVSRAVSSEGDLSA